MSDIQIGLVVNAVGLPKERERLMESVRELSFQPHAVAVVTEAEYGDADMTKFNPNRARNIGIRALLPQVDGIVCLDADYIVPPGLFDICAEPHMQKFHIWIRRRDITEEQAKPRNWKQWLNLPVFPDCWGSCSYLSCHNWKVIGGWNEKAYGWGGDDDLLMLESGKRGIERRRIDMFPLMHIAHEPRPFSGINSRGNENMKLAPLQQDNYLS